MALMPATGAGCNASSALPSRIPFQRSVNSEIEWDNFDPGAYVRHNYSILRAYDREILCRVRDFFADANMSGVRCVDVGSGANLYPVLPFLPFAHSVDLCEWSTSNVNWLRAQIDSYDEFWDPYWQVCAEHPAYAAMIDPRSRLAQVGRVLQVSVFDLPRHAWDAGTMFFVACSISADRTEFEQAIGRFLGALRPGSPFAAAFMLGSRGYRVGQRWFPAVELRRAEVLASIGSSADELEFHEVHPTPPLRDEYLSMLLITGHTRG